MDLPNGSTSRRIKTFVVKRASCSKHATKGAKTCRHELERLRAMHVHASAHVATLLSPCDFPSSDLSSPQRVPPKMIGSPLKPAKAIIPTLPNMPSTP